MTETLSLFVYGTLRKGEPLEDWLTGSENWRKNACVQGRIYPIFSGSYPVAKFNQDGLIHGEIVNVNITSEVISCIRMEMSAGYEAKEVSVLDIDGALTGETVWAFDYALRLPGTECIQSGDWLEYVREHTPTAEADGFWDENARWLHKNGYCLHCGSQSNHICYDAEGTEYVHEGPNGDEPLVRQSCVACPSVATWICRDGLETITACDKCRDWFDTMERDNSEWEQV